jgi:hypothetical protein
MLFAAAPVATQVTELYHISPATYVTKSDLLTVRIAPGAETVVADIQGSGKITYFYITYEWDPGVVLKIYWDGEKEPSVNVPLGEFFGAFGRNAIEYESAFTQINHRNYMSYLPMPFSKRARIVLANDGDKEYHTETAYGLDYELSPQFASEPGRLHAQWRRSNPTNGMHTILEAKGRGQYVGNFLQVYSRYWGWWGEGDTIFTVDGRRMTHTPGTEDEYGACYEFGHLYSYLYSGYIQQQNFSSMGDQHHLMYRWYSANPVRFRETLKIEIQNQRVLNGQQVNSSDDYTSVAFWYQEEPHQAFSLPPATERMAPTRAVTYEVR